MKKLNCYCGASFEIEIKENETGISKIPEHIYNNISDNLEERLKDPGIKELMSLPYRSINTISTEVQ